MFGLRKRRMQGPAGGVATMPQAYMFGVAAIFILGSLLYTRWAVNQLKEYERNASEIYAKAYAWVVNRTVVYQGLLDDQDLFIWDEVVQKTLFPVIVTDVEGNVRASKGTRVGSVEDPAERARRLRELVRKMDKAHPPIPLRVPQSEAAAISPDTPVRREGQHILIGYIHFGESSMINQLTWMPYVWMLGIGFLGLIGWLGFRNIKNSEQRHIWVGLAKETAHQLGTPISSLLGWLELIKTHLRSDRRRPRDEHSHDLRQIVEEIESDTRRLSKIASRFSQIGSVPELRSERISDVVEETIQYFSKRLPHLERDIQISQHYGHVPDILVNRELLGWALENLFKNAADAIDHEGGLIVVSVRRSSDDKYVNVYITDNGRGIDQKSRHAIFGPGYTTKKRGWGIGLNFVKRIVEGYHGGKVVLQESAPGEGTTIKVSLPIREQKDRAQAPQEAPSSAAVSANADGAVQGPPGKAHT